MLPITLLLCFGLTGCASGDRLPSVPISLADGDTPVRRAGDLIYRGGLSLRMADPDFGGLSALRISPDGTQFVAIADRGRRVTGRLSYRPDGDLAAAHELSLAPLLDVDGAPLHGAASDSEGLALLGPWPGQGWVVSLERDHRLLRYGPALAGVTPQRLNAPAELVDLPLNSGLETLLSLADGRLLMIAEGERNGRHPAWIGRPSDWTRFDYQGTPPFLPVDATRLPDGGLLVLERRVGLLGGWGSRFVHITPQALAAGTAPGAVLTGQEIGRLDVPMNVENFEGIDVRQTADGRLMVYIIADNNFFVLQRTLMMMFEWRP